MEARNDIIVIGAGGMGSAALYEVARRGLKVLGLEQFEIAHDRGSSHGQTRIIRKSYFEHPDYVPLLERAYALWAQLEQQCAQKLYIRTGLLVGGHPQGGVVRGVREAARIHSLAIQSVTPADIRQRFGGFALPDDLEATFEEDAGYLRVEACLRSCAAAAERHGARILSGQTVRQWTADANGVVVHTDTDTYSAQSLIICAGPWSSQLLADLHLPLEVRRKVLFWHRTGSRVYDVSNGCPVFAFDIPDGFFYGFPVIDDVGLKVAEHTAGRVVQDPLNVNQQITAEDHAPVQAFLTKYLPEVLPCTTKQAVCMYTMTPDEHFIIDRHPHHPHIAYACGFSGHGFKFAPVVGAVLADLAITGSTDEPVSFLSASRFKIQP